MKKQQNNIFLFIFGLFLLPFSICWADGNKDAQTENVIPNLYTSTNEESKKTDEPFTSGPKFDKDAIALSLVYPPDALSLGIEGKVIIELFVDDTGLIQKIIIFSEEPKDMGFGEAAVNAFTGRRGTPAFVNGKAVSCRYRYPVNFNLKEYINII